MSRKSQIVAAKSEGEIFVAALRCSDPEERRRLLDTECGSDPPLREVVEELLEESSGIGTFLEQPAVRGTRGLDSTGSIDGCFGTGEELGDQIGPYELVDLIGEGGGGSVYLAEQSEPVQRTVALKILKLGMDTKSVIARFEAERQTLALMEHPNIARVIDAGATEAGRPYFVMEYVPGDSVTDYCDANSLTVEERLSIFIDVCRAVEHAHQKGIIHRDLKPSNILVTEQDGEPVPKVIDFGVAKAIDPLSTGKVALTLIESFIGTPAYMSPEQAERDHRDIDTRSDVYSLGVLLYELLTSYTPLDAPKDLRSGIGQVRRSLREATLLWPSARLRASSELDHREIEFDRGTTMDRLASKLRGDLDWVVMKCLERDRSRRFGSASELARDLELYLEGAPVTARPPSAAYRVGKFVRRHRVAVVSCSLLAMTLIGAATVSMALAVRATRAEQDMRMAHRVQSELRAEAVGDRERALISAAAAHLHQYVADINLSQLAVEDGNIAEALHLLDRHAVETPGGKDLRGFEWRYLVGQCRGDRHTSLPVQDRPIDSLALSPTGRLLAIGTSDGTRIWDISVDRLLITLPGDATSVAFFPSGDRIAVGGSEGVTVYDLDSTIPVREPNERGGALALSPDGSLLAASGRRGVSIWNTANWSRIRHLPWCSGPLAFSPDGGTLATGSREGITLRSLERFGRRVVLEESPTALRGRVPGGDSMVFSRDGDFVLAAHNLKPTRHGYFMGIWDAKSGKEVSMLPANQGDGGHAGIVSSASFDQAGRLLATGSWDHSLRLWDFESRSAVRELHGHRGEVTSVALSSDGELVASGSKNGEVKLWPTRQKVTENLIEGRWKPLRFSEDGRYLAALGREGSIAVFNMHTRESIYSIPLSNSNSRFAPSAVSLSRDLKVLAESRSDGTVTIRELEKKRESSLKVSNGRLDFLALSPLADTLVTGSGRAELAWWDLSAPDKPLAKVAGSFAEFSEDGSTLAMMSREGDAIIWDAATRQERVRIAQRGRSLGSRIALSPDGSLIARIHGYDDIEHTISLWDTTTGKELGTLKGHKQGIWSIAISPDGRTIASSSGGGTLRFWNVESGSKLMTIREPGTNLSDLRFSPDGQYLVGGTLPFAATGKLRIFHAPPPELPAATVGKKP